MYHSWFNNKEPVLKMCSFDWRPLPLSVYLGRQNVILVIKWATPSPSILHTTSDQKLLRKSLKMRLEVPLMLVQEENNLKSARSVESSLEKSTFDLHSISNKEIS